MTDYKTLVEQLRRPHLRNPDGGGNVFSEAADAVEALVAERDTLRAQLDGMTTETRRLRRPDKGRLMTTAAPIVAEQRLVGPWVEVTD